MGFRLLGSRTLTRLCTHSYFHHGKRTISSVAGFSPARTTALFPNEKNCTNGHSVNVDFGQAFDFTQPESSLDHSTRIDDQIVLCFDLDLDDDGG